MEGSSIGIKFEESVSLAVGSCEWFLSNLASSALISRPGQLHIRTSQAYRPKTCKLDEEEETCVVFIIIKMSSMATYFVKDSNVKISLVGRRFKPPWQLDRHMNL